MTAPNIHATQLRAFLEVARTGSFTKAGEALGYSQPAVYQQVSALRQILGGSLFERRGGRMCLTALGEALLPDAERIVAEIDAMVERLQRSGMRDAVALSVGVGPYTGSYIFPAIAGMFRDRFPDVDIAVRGLHPEEVMQGVADGELDLGFYASAFRYFEQFPHDAGQIVAVPWLPSPAVLCGTRDVIMGITPFSPRPITVYIPQNMSDARPQISASLEAAGITMRFMDTKDAETAKTAASAHLGLAWVPWFTARHALARGQLEEFGPRLALRHSWIHLIHRRPVSNRALGAMIHFLHEVRRLPAIRQFVFPEDFAVSLHGEPSLVQTNSPRALDGAIRLPCV